MNRITKLNSEIDALAWEVVGVLDVAVTNVKWLDLRRVLAERIGIIREETGEKIDIVNMISRSKAMNDLVLTDSERDLILKLREWKDGIPEDLVGHRENAIYVSLVAARADLYRMAIQLGYNDMLERKQAMMDLVSPWLLMDLCKAWQDLRHREAEDELNIGIGDEE